MMFRFYCQLPAGAIQIPWPRNICFQDDMAAAVVDLAKDAGETAAKVETLEEQTQQAQEKTEELENRVKWNDEALDRAFERIWALESTVEDLKARVEILEAQPAPEEKNETEFDPGELEHEEQKKPAGRRRLIGLF